MDLARLASRSYDTFLCRARASQRLATRGTLWAVALAASSTSTLAVSMVALVNDRVLSGKADLWACLSSLVTLVLSLVVGTFNFSGRSRDMFHSYRLIQKISVTAERLADQDLSADQAASWLERLDNQYQQALDVSENHNQWDYFRIAKPSDPERRKSMRRNRWRAIVAQGSLDSLPLIITMASIALAVVTMVGA